MPTQHLIYIQMCNVSIQCPTQKQGQSSQPWLSLIYSQHRWLITKHVSPPAESQPVHNALHLYHIRCFWNAGDLNAVRKGTSLLCAPQADNRAGFLGQRQAASGTEEGSSRSILAAETRLKGDCVMEPRVAVPGESAAFFAGGQATNHIQVWSHPSSACG